MKRKIFSVILVGVLLVGVGGLPGVLNLISSPVALVTGHEMPSLVPEAQAITVEGHADVFGVKVWVKIQFCEG